MPFVSEKGSNICSGAKEDTNVHYDYAAHLTGGRSSSSFVPEIILHPAHQLLIFSTTMPSSSGSSTTLPSSSS